MNIKMTVHTGTDIVQIEYSRINTCFKWGSEEASQWLDFIMTGFRTNKALRQELDTKIVKMLVPNLI